MQALESAGVKAGQRVLIHAGAGGVGTFAVQLAKARGAHVITTVGPRNLDFVKQVCSCASALAVVSYVLLNIEKVPLLKSCVLMLMPCLHSVHEHSCALQELGADEAIDYTTQHFDEVLKSNAVDAVIDCMGGDQPAHLNDHPHPNACVQQSTQQWSTMA